MQHVAAAKISGKLGNRAGTRVSSTKQLSHFSRHHSHPLLNRSLQLKKTAGLSNSGPRIACRNASGALLFRRGLSLTAFFENLFFSQSIATSGGRDVYLARSPHSADHSAIGARNAESGKRRDWRHDDAESQLVGSGSDIV